jgi:hypothetical protein
MQTKINWLSYTLTLQEKQVLTLFCKPAFGYQLGDSGDAPFKCCSLGIFYQQVYP